MNNFDAMAHEATTFEKIGLADAAGLDRAAATGVLGASSGSSRQFTHFAGGGFAPKVYPGGIAARVVMMEKDLDLLCSLDIARTTDLSATVALIRGYLQRLRAAAGSDPAAVRGVG